MSELKNLKVSEETHLALTTRAKRLGMKIHLLAEAMLIAGLRQADRKLLDEVMQLQEARTIQDAPPGSSQSPGHGKANGKRRNAP